MKCPKCEYISFDTGERCRNCGYEFSLIADAPLVSAATTPAPDLDLRLRDDDAAAPHPPPSFRGEPALPLFGPGAPNDDEPLIKVPAAPRPPLAVRRTPDTPRFRAATKHQRVIEPTLSFQDSPEPAPRRAEVARTPPPSMVVSPDAVTSGIARRVGAGLIDVAILLVIDATVMDFTLRLASLTWADWRMVPIVPMLAFLGLIKLAYFSVFTAVGGQTIGKMAAGIRVVGDTRTLVEPSRAVQRSVLGALSLAILGAGFIPLFFGSDHRALHDRVAHTRVVTVPAA
jgi:uncharacterized RDD family membrane protein YckC